MSAGHPFVFHEMSAGLSMSCPPKSAADNFCRQIRNIRGQRTDNLADMKWTSDGHPSDVRLLVGIASDDESSVDTLPMISSRPRPPKRRSLIPVFTRSYSLRQRPLREEAPARRLQPEEGAV